MARLQQLLLVAAPLAAALTVHSSAQDILTVGTDGLSPYLQIQAAIDAAPSGSLIVVRPGVYQESLSIGDKSLQLVAPAPDSVRIEGVVSIDGLAPSTEVLLHGLEVAPTYAGDAPSGAIVLSNSAGSIVLHECDFRGSNGVYDYEQGQTGALVRSCERVTAIRSQFVGGDAPLYLSYGGYLPGGHGVSVLVGQVAFYDCEVRGGRGEMVFPLNYEPGGHGGDGLVLNSGRAYGALSSFVGGDGGRGGSGFSFPPGGDGGDGVIANVHSAFFQRSSTRDGGDPGNSAAGALGSPGSDFSGTGRDRSLAFAPSVHSGSIFALGQTFYDVELQGLSLVNANLHILEATPFIFDAAPRATSGSMAPVAFPRPLGEPIFLGQTLGDGSLLSGIGIPALPLAPAARSFTFAVLYERDQRRLHTGSPLPIVAINCDSAGADCDGSGRSDLCEYLEGTLIDENHNLVPDSCEPDCNGNGVPDDLDILNGTSLDADGDGIPDEC